MSLPLTDVPVLFELRALPNYVSLLDWPSMLAAMLPSALARAGRAIAHSEKISKVLIARSA